MAKSTEVQLPLMGEGVHEATVVEWLKSPGERVEIDDPLVSVSTDKVDTEIPAPAAGYLIATFAEIGAAVQVDQIIAQISEDKNAAVIEPGIVKPANAGAPAPAALAAPTQKRAPLSRSKGQPRSAPMESPVPGSYAGVVRSSPLVRKLARENGVDLRVITGTGLHGRITRRDLDEYLAGGGTRIPRLATEDSAPPGLGELHRQKTVTTDGVETLEGVPVRREKMSKIRWLTAEHMLRSVQTSPHVTTTIEVDLHRVAAHRSKRKTELGEEGRRLTYTAYFIEAAIAALKQYPEVNASVDGDEILFKEDINVGCAVAIESGLIVPVIKRANEFSLLDCAAALADIADRARNGKLKPDDIKGGTFSITNPGMYGSLHSQPIINQPQVAIMSVGAIVKRPVFFEGEVVVHPVCQIGLTFDHRIVDGEGGAKFLAAIRGHLETPGDRV